ncbi:uncharacterized protein LOC143637186 [Bidens hawaiensis]|uniref:uncharacterized protein LOC143637186 n=1 Tax=Bidens hawaiensis TaxID=980011 RepID=UPI00404A16B7
MTQERDSIWKLFTEGASNDEGLSVGLRLTDPEGHEFTYAVLLEFKSTNNDEEYEAFLVGLRIARKMGARHLEVYVNSMLVSDQIDGSYEAKGEKMAFYLTQAKALMQSFATCKVIHIKYNENKQADALRKLASVSFKHLVKDINVDILCTP